MMITTKRYPGIRRLKLKGTDSLTLNTIEDFHRQIFTTGLYWIFAIETGPHKCIFKLESLRGGASGQKTVTV